MSASAAMSQTSVSGLDGVSANSSFVFGCIAAFHCAASVCETKVVATPNFAKSCIKFNDDMFAWLSEHKEIKTVILGSPWTAAVPEQKSAERDYVAKTTGEVGYQLMEETFKKVKALGVNVVATYGTHSFKLVLLI